MKLIKSIIVLTALLNMCKCNKNAQILEEKFQLYKNGGYFFKYVTSNGQKRSESATIKHVGEKSILSIIGYYSYILDGKQYSRYYRVDENGSVDKDMPFEETHKYLATALNSGFRIGSSLVSTLAGGGIG